MKKNETLTNHFIKQIEKDIFSGELPIGKKLPSERDIAISMKISRVIVHSGLVELAAKGIITIVPRVGAFVNDYKMHSDLNILGLMCNNEDIDVKVAEGLIKFRYLVEVETARLAAVNRSNDELKVLKKILKEEDWLEEGEIDKMTELDFRFHHQIAMMSSNVIYPAILKSLENMYKKHVYEFYEKSGEYEKVFGVHKELYQAIMDESEEKAADIMNRMLKHGEEQVRKLKIII